MFKERSLLSRRKFSFQTINRFPVISYFIESTYYLYSLKVTNSSLETYMRTKRTYFVEYTKYMHVISIRYSYWNNSSVKESNKVQFLKCLVFIIQDMILFNFDNELTRERDFIK